MKTLKSKILGEEIIIVENPEEYDEAIAKARELNCAVYTVKEINYLTELVEKMSIEEKTRNLILVNNVKKTFDGFYQIPKDWKPKK